MRNLSVVLVLLLALIGCGEKNSYQIEGVVDSALEGSIVFLQESVGRDLVNLDSVVIEDGKFTFTGTVEDVNVLMLSVSNVEGGRAIYRAPFVLEPGNIIVSLDETTVLGGTRLNEVFNEYNSSQQELQNQLRPIIDRFQKAAQDGSFKENPNLEAEIMGEYNAMMERSTEMNISFVKENLDNEVGLFVFNNNAGRFELETQKEILAAAGDLFHKDENVQRLITRIENAEKVAVGKPFVDFTMKDPKGNEISLSDYAGKGKVVLIDFWAAWCGPCRNEMPNVVDAYNKYKDKGFEIVGVSLDRTHEEWMEGIETLKMEWPQMSDMKFWETPVVDLYAFQGIPHTVLLDGEGTIVDKNLRGQALHEKLSELLD